MASMQTSTQIREKLMEAVASQKPIVGAAIGCGLFAGYAEAGGADLILVLNAGRFRLMGCGSTASLLPFGNSNRMVMDIGVQEVLRQVRHTPCIFGLCATDPEIELESYLDEIKEAGFAGMTNFPTVGLIDGVYGEALHEAGISFDKEVEAVARAVRKGLFAVAFVFSADQARRMAAAGADIICAHLGFTQGGGAGVKGSMTMEQGIALSRTIFRAAAEVNPHAFKLVYGGPVSSPEDADRIYRGTDAMGCIGGSSFERIPTETSIVRVTELFKNYEEVKSENKLLRQQLDLQAAIEQADYVRYVTLHVSLHLHEPVSFDAIAKGLHLNRNYLSQLFTRKMGMSFSRWLIRQRIQTAKEWLGSEEGTIHDAAARVGYSDASYFSRIFKKETGMTPSEWKERQGADPER
ncbi:TIM-barrel signal transduction protein [Paenibacillus pasadenensis]|uniref:TIM-barrel signal transduction protein n=2 Tax=Paenibacillus TaxID=44249 RepID=A0A2N5NCU1_9BACL|nr:TIM-barrel signal transduction protein [Paenibacillus pasadenensis]